MAMMRYGSAEVVEPSISSDQWTKSVCCGHKSCSCGTEKGCRTKVAKTILAKYAPEKYLLSHCTIVASVKTELADKNNPKSDYFIHTAFSKLVNNNGDAWTDGVIANSYRTFIGSNNFLEHVQIPELSKGKVIDAVLREVPVGKDRSGKDLTSYYVDILVATERKHKDLVAKIESGELRTLSMGCRIAYSICSKCGNKAVDETQACDHVKYEKNNVFYDESGTQRKIAELCGHASEPDSVIFMDASWVKTPAFTGAVVRNVVNPPENVMAKIKQAESISKDYEFTEADFLKAASKKAQDAPKEDTPSAEPSDTGAPSAEEPPMDTGDAGTPPDTGAPPPPAPEKPEINVKTIKDQIKQNILEQISDEITQEFSGETEEGRPTELETLDENIIQPTASQTLKQLWATKKGWDAYLQKRYGSLKTESFRKLKTGAYMLLTSKDHKTLADYGYNKRDFLAVMSCVSRLFKSPLSRDVVASIAQIGTSKNLGFKQACFALQKNAGRKLEAQELSKALTWLKMMDAFVD